MADPSAETIGPKIFSPASPFARVTFQRWPFGDAGDACTTQGEGPATLGALMIVVSLPIDTSATVPLFSATTMWPSALRSRPLFVSIAISTSSDKTYTVAQSALTTVERPGQLESVVDVPLTASNMMTPPLLSVRKTLPLQKAGGDEEETGADHNRWPVLAPKACKALSPAIKTEVPPGTAAWQLLFAIWSGVRYADQRTVQFSRKRA